jgi:hypothetical protein
MNHQNQPEQMENEVMFATGSQESGTQPPSMWCASAWSGQTQSLLNARLGL